MITASSTIKEKIYRPTRAWQSIHILFIVLFGLITLMALLPLLDSLFSSTSPSKWALIGVQGLFLITGVFYTWFFVQDFCHHKLVISQKGVKYYRFHYIISATWDDVKKIESNLGNRTLLLRNPKVKTRRYFSWLLGEKNRMPINIFGNWHKNGFRDSLIQFAPHLFERD